jgi:cathepsin E
MANPIIVRDSLVSLSFARNLNVTSSNNLVLRDLSHAKHLVSLSNDKQGDNLSADPVVGVDVTNVASIYQVNVGVGSPATSCELQWPIFIEFTIICMPCQSDTLFIDTGSANTWVGA